jgi:predicted Zn-dependent protease
VEEGTAGLRGERRVQRFLNSEGSWHRTGTLLLEVTLRAMARAEDGTRVSDTRRFFARRPADLPSRERLAQAARELARAVSDLAAAKKAEEYVGPVLFTGDAAALFFDRLLADGVSDTTPPVGGAGRGARAVRADSLAGQVGRRILPAGVSAVDDPTRSEVDGAALFGGYAVDDDSVPAAPVTLVEDGILKGVYVSRIGAKEATASNGHGRRAGGDRVTGQPANLIVTAREGATDLKERLVALCKDEKLPYGLIVERLTGATAGPARFGRGGGGPGGRRGRGFGAAPEERSDLPDAIGFRKIYPDGREEVIRGGRFAGVTARALRGIAATGADRNVLTRRLAGTGPAAVTIVAPSVLLRDVEVRATNQEGVERPPLLPQPPLE